MQILDGRKIADIKKEKIKREIEEKNIKAKLAVILVGDDPASKVYVGHKKRACERVGLDFELFEVPVGTKEAEIITLIEKLNKDSQTSAILLQLPLPTGFGEQKIIASIDPAKDADCFHPVNIGKMFVNNPFVVPATPAGVMEIFREYKIDLVGKNCLVVGKSNIVGKPMALMLANANATVAMAHSKTRNLKELALWADVIVSAVGKPNLITADMIKTDVVLVDVGINRLPDGSLVGDVDFAGCADKASFISPVPGGVGPMTVAMLLENVVKIVISKQ